MTGWRFCSEVQHFLYREPLASSTRHHVHRPAALERDEKQQRIQRASQQTETDHRVLRNDPNKWLIFLQRETTRVRSANALVNMASSTDD